MEEFPCVRFDETKISFFDEEERDSVIFWKDLQKVSLEITDVGPFAPDVFWQLESKAENILIAQGTTGEADLMNRLQQLPGFDSNSIILAMACVEEGSFLCWKKD